MTPGPPAREGEGGNAQPTRRPQWVCRFGRTERACGCCAPFDGDDRRAFAHQRRDVGVGAPRRRAHRAQRAQYVDDGLGGARPGPPSILV